MLGDWRLWIVALHVDCVDSVDNSLGRCFLACVKDLPAAFQNYPVLQRTGRGMSHRF